jgi:hypothetical protein
LFPHSDIPNLYFLNPKEENQGIRFEAVDRRASSPRHLGLEKKTSGQIAVTK